VKNAPTPAPVATAAPPPTAAPAPPPQPEASAPPRAARPSGEFNALEADFFAREADLYKHDKPESFDDLERGPGGPRRR
jgi:hypothetical protein